jgi:hypothetical protein
MSNHCTEHFDEELPASMLAKRCKVTMSYSPESSKILVTFVCPHGSCRRHSVYCGSRDWDWCQSVMMSEPVAA